MNLLEFRLQAREMSGLFDLVNEDGSDNGMDFYINAGQKFLDRLDETQKSWAWTFKWVEYGFWGVSFNLCRAIKEVWLATSTARWQLEKKALQDLMEGYLTGLPSSRTVGAPEYYSPIITRYVPEGGMAGDIEAYAGWTDVLAGEGHEFNGIILNVPVSEKTSVQINGLFYSRPLVADTDENYWSVNHPNILYMATMRQIEVKNRNTQGVNDWNNAIKDEVTTLGFDLVEELISEVNQIED